MKKSYTISGIGVCLGKKAGYESLAEAVITGVSTAGKEMADSLNLAVQEALQYADRKDLLIVTDTQASGLGEQKVCAGLREMLEAAPESALLLSRRENGWLSMVLSQQERGFARVEICDDGRNEDCDGFWKLLLTALEIRFALHLDDRDSPYRFWDARDARSKELHCCGLRLRVSEPRIPASKVYAAGKYILPVVFTTEEEAKRKLTALKQASGLKTAMEHQLSQLERRTEQTNTIVLLADSLKTLNEDIDDLLQNADRLLEKGFAWKRPSGSRYLSRSCASPKIVFMNPPASMFNARAFYKFFFTLYGTMQEISHFETDRLLTGDKDVFLSDYFFDVVVNYCVTGLRESIGIKPDVMSGASMGEMANILRHLEYSDGTMSEIGALLAYIEKTLAFMLRSDDAPLNNYLGRETDGFTKFYAKGDAAAICRAAEKYDGAFVMIVGSTEDVILTGEHSALRKVVEETGCVVTELNVANYIHTPAVEHLADEVRQGLIRAGLRLAPLEYTMFSTQFLKPLDNTVEMMADNTARLVTRTVDYAAAVEELYNRDGRVFIDLSTNQMCGNWAGATLKNHRDAVVASLYSAVEPSEMLLNLCAALLASNVSFEQQKLLERLSFPAGRVQEKTPPQKGSNAYGETC